MGPSRSGRVLLLCCGTFALAGPAAAPASATAGGALAPSASGGTGYGAPIARAARRPVASVFRVAPRTLTVGALPRLAIRIEQRGVRQVRARIALLPRHGGPTVHLDLGVVPTGRLLHPTWPAGQSLAPGRYVVRLHVRDPSGATLRRRGHETGRAELIVKARPKPKPKPAPAPAPPAAVPAPAIPDPGVTPGGVFPVSGTHTYGGDDARFGAGRTGHIHQGQDVLAPEGTPVAAPEAGTIIARDNQPGGAGYYVAMDAIDGRSFFFAHCQADSTAVTVGQVVPAGQPLCRVGHTGDATGPHLHFEIWIAGWHRSTASHPVDPLPQLQAWDH